MTTFYFLRHGEHGLLGRVLAGRMPGVGLTEGGREEIAAAAERLAGAEIVALYSSPLQRTRESAEIVAERLGLPVTYRDDLIELDFGDWTGATFDSIRADPRWHMWNTHRSIATIPGGESMRDVQRRAVEAVMELHAQHSDESIVLVSHGDVIRGALVYLLGMPLEFLTRIEVSQGSISTVRIDAGGVRLLALNERPRFR